MISFSDIQKANESIRTTDIKGKEYAEVNQRIKAFRQVFPSGFIVTAQQTDEGGRCVFRAEVGFYDDNGNAKVLGSGTAYEQEGSSYINKTSYIENCETSAVGRALGMCGFGIDTSVASYEEVQNAIVQQENLDKTKKRKAKASEDPGTITPEQMVTIHDWTESQREWALKSAQKLMEGLDVQKISDFSEAVAQTLIEKFKKAEGRK